MMRTGIFTLVLSLLLGFSALAAPLDINTHTAAVPEPSFKLAATWFLPDWQAALSGRTDNAPDNSGDRQDLTCSTYGGCANIPANTTCSQTFSAKGATCYKSCSCKSGYNQVNNADICQGCANPCDTVTAVATPYGCKTPWPVCPSKCQVAYPDNCHNRTAVSTPYGCQTPWSDCSTKCQVAYPDNCHNRIAVPTPYGCQTNFSDCSTKCQTAYPDNCRNYSSKPLASSCANGCAQGKTISDCTTRCAVGCKARCDTGYHLSSDQLSCVADSCPSGYETGKTCGAGYTLEKSGQAGTQYCGKCVVKACAAGSTSCAAGQISEANGYYSGEQPCYTCKNNTCQCKETENCVNDKCVDACGTTLKPGDYLYSDATACRKLLPSKTVTGVIFDADGKKAVSINTAEKKFYSRGNYGTTAPYRLHAYLSDIDGKIDSFYLSDTSEAAQYCYHLSDYVNFKYTDTRAMWYLPSVTELQTLYANLAAVNQALKNAGYSAIEAEHLPYEQNPGDPPPPPGTLDENGYLISDAVLLSSTLGFEKTAGSYSKVYVHRMTFETYTGSTDKYYLSNMDVSRKIRCIIAYENPLSCYPGYYYNDSTKQCLCTTTNNRYDRTHFCISSAHPQMADGIYGMDEWPTDLCCPYMMTCNGGLVFDKACRCCNYPN